jgi:hypothetical protein
MPEVITIDSDLEEKSETSLPVTPSPPTRLPTPEPLIHQAEPEELSIGETSPLARMEIPNSQAAASPAWSSPHSFSGSSSSDSGEELSTSEQILGFLRTNGTGPLACTTEPEPEPQLDDDVLRLEASDEEFELVSEEEVEVKTEPEPEPDPDAILTEGAVSGIIPYFNWEPEQELFYPHSVSGPTTSGPVPSTLYEHNSPPTDAGGHARVPHSLVPQYDLNPSEEEEEEEEKGGTECIKSWAGDTERPGEVVIEGPALWSDPSREPSALEWDRLLEEHGLYGLLDAALSGVIISDAQLAEMGILTLRPYQEEEGPL